MMMRTGKPLIFFALLLAGISLFIQPHLANAASDIRVLRSGFWKGAVRANDDGKVSSCHLLARVIGKDLHVILSWNRLGFHVALYDERWRLQKGEESKARVKVDRRFSELIEVSVRTANMIDYVFGFNERAWQAIQAGNRISLEGPAGKKSFPLNGTRRAINVLLDCADEYFSPSEEPKQDKVKVQARSPVPNYDTGMKAYKAKDYSAALKEWKPLAAQGHGKAQNHLGFMYSKGMGLTVNFTEAIFWFRKSAEQGIAGAQYNLGVMYQKGNGVAKDVAEAIFWYRKAVDQKLARAQYNLGVMYENGEGVAKNTTEAIRWYRKAAAQGYVAARNQLKKIEVAVATKPLKQPEPVRPVPVARQPVASSRPMIGPLQPIFAPGVGIEVQFSGLPANGQDWLAISGKGQGPKQYFDFTMLKNRPHDGVHQFKPLPEGMYEVRLYTDWPNGGYKVVSSAEVRVAAQPVQPNRNSAPPYLPALQKKADEGDPSAMLMYGLALLEGKILPQNAAAAAKWISAAADADDRRAVYFLSILLEYGIGISRDTNAAAELLNKAAETGLPQALFLRAQKTVDTRPGRALRDINVAAAQAYIPAIKVLEKMTEQ